MTVAPLLIGVTLGVRHAFEPDHLAALSTLASEKQGPRASLTLGALWGLGHTAGLLLLGGSLALLGATLPARIESLLELGVSVMIIALGIRAVLRAAHEGRTGEVHAHEHFGHEHVHAAPSEHVHLSRWPFATRPLLIGAIHGLAGSGALTALVLAELPDVSSRVSYIVLFGLGSVVGMALLTGLAGAQVSRLVRTPRLAAALLFTTGVTSTLVGLWWGQASLHSLLS